MRLTLKRQILSLGPFRIRVRRLAIFRVGAFIGRGGAIDGKVNPELVVHEGDRADRRHPKPAGLRLGPLREPGAVGTDEMRDEAERAH